MKAEIIFEHMVVRSAFVSSPDSMSQATITGRYDNATRIDAQLPSYLSNILSANSAGYIPVAESDLSASAPSWFPHALGGKEEGGYIKGMRVNLGMDRASQAFLCHCSNREVSSIVFCSLNILHFGPSFSFFFCKFSPALNLDGKVCSCAVVR